VFVGSQFRLGSTPQFQTLAEHSCVRVIGQGADCQITTQTVSSRRAQVGRSKNRAAGTVAPMDRAAVSECSDKKIVSRCRERARRVYYRTVFEINMEIPDYL
jgi:hypothetical protein